MPIKRKICKIGTGLAVFLPKSWVQLLEKKHGKVEAVAIEVDDALVLTPIFEGILRMVNLHGTILLLDV